MLEPSRCLTEGWEISTFNLNATGFTIVSLTDQLSEAQSDFIRLWTFTCQPAAAWRRYSKLEIIKYKEGLCPNVT